MIGAATEMSRDAVRPETSAEVPVDHGRSAESHRFLSILGVVRGEAVEVRNALVGGIAAQKVGFERAVVRTAFASGDLNIHQGAAQLIVAGRDASIVQGAAQAIVSNGSVRMEKAGGGITLARSIDVSDRSTVVFGITPHLVVNDGGRVIFGPRAAVLAAGAMSALVAAIVALRLRIRAVEV